MSAGKLSKTAICAGLLIALSACANPNEVAMKVGAPPVIKQQEGKSTLNLRALQIRRFETGDERQLLQAATQTLQDLGYIITESSLEAGVLVGRKKRDAVERDQVVGQIALAVLFAALGSRYDPVWDKQQTIFVTLVTTPIKNSKQVELRVSFDRRLVNNRGQLWRTELITDKPIYQEFFDKLANSTFLEAHDK